MFALFPFDDFTVQNRFVREKNVNDQRYDVNPSKLRAYYSNIIVYTVPDLKQAALEALTVRPCI